MKKLLYFALLLFVTAPAWSQAPTPPPPGGTPDYFGMYANYATSALPLRSCSDVAHSACYGNLDCVALVDAATSGPAVCSGPVTSGGIRKFVDTLPNLPIASPDLCNYSGQDADCYEIHLREYSTAMHADLPPTKLRGYIQVKNGVDVGTISYLGPVIVATRDKPVRIKFFNELPTGSGGDLFIPTDTTYMGAGAGPAGTNYTQNRATLHLHGGTTPWISDGTPHQWTTPAGESTAYPKGVSVRDVPDMPAAADGSLTFFYSNQQSARLMFYHDHAYGITRLNVYAGEAAGYVLTDSVETALIRGGTITPPTGSPVNVAAGTLPNLGLPLIIQDKTFVWGTPPVVDPNTNAVTTPGTGTWASDPTWNWGKDSNGQFLIGALWFPHVYMPNQNPEDLSGANPMGRWDYGPWFWPPFTGLKYGPVPNPYYDPNCVSSPTQYCEPSVIPGTPNPSGVPESFMDTPVVNGKAYPVLHVPAGPVRFRILNAANDRYWNLSLFVADPSVSTQDGRGNTEVKMVPFNSSSGVSFPSWWGTLDGRDGGVPDPATRGPAMVQIGTEGGFLPYPVVIKNQPINYNYNRRDITVLNVLEKALFLGPAERADVVVDFTNFAGKTLLLYNDAPAPVPAADPRIDYYTGNPDQTDTGGAPSTQPGYGPNTRTIMQIVVGGSGGGAPVDDVNNSILSALQTALPAAFAASQDTIIVPQAPYNVVYHPAAPFKGDASVYVKISDTSFSFTPIGASAPVTADLGPKAIVEDFQMDYGRMNALLGVEIPHTNMTNQTSIPQGYIDPPTELVKFSDGRYVATSLGTLADGTQLWKITHNGVDTHAVHFHMFNVQIVNRVGWDGAIKPPEANELGWKDTVRMNPLEDVIIALRPITLTNVPFELPNSVRPLDVTMPVDSMSMFFNVDPNGNPVMVMNKLINFGWEYVWHCHLLGHEENDMMRAMAFAVPPKFAPVLAASYNGTQVNLSWTEASRLDSFTGFTLFRASDAAFTQNMTILGTFPPAASGAATDTGVADGVIYYYALTADNLVGYNDPATAYPVMNAAALSNVQAVTTPLKAPTSLIASAAGAHQINLSWTNNTANTTGIQIWRDNGAGGSFSRIATTTPGTATAYTDTTALDATTYRYYVVAVNAVTTSAASNTASATTPLAAPTNLALVSMTTTSITMNWTKDATTTAQGFYVERAPGLNGGTFTRIATVTPATTTQYTNTGLLKNTTYRYRVQAYKGAAVSAYSNVLTATTPKK